MRAKILLVDDEETVRKTVERILIRAGFEVGNASNGREAQLRLAEGEYDVAVVDLYMPDVDGFQVLEWMQIHAPGVVPVIVSGTSRIEDAIQAVQQGAFDFVSKPVEHVEDLIQHIQRAVDHKRLRDSNAKLLHELQQTNIELENRLSQLELAHSILQSQAVAIQVDLNRAMRIQHGLLPRETPFADIVSVAACYQPLAKVGGDLYDVFRVDDRHVGLYIADTSGHGVSSAMLTIFLNHAVDNLCRIGSDGRVRDPGELLCDLNRTIIEESFGQGIFVSMTYVVLDVHTGRLQYSSAGHPPMLFRTASGTVELVKKPAPVLGVNPRVKYTAESLELASGDMLVLYTDGITEARNLDGDFYGVERLREAVASADCHADTIAQAVEHQLAEFCEGRQRADDITLLVLGMEPQRIPLSKPEEKPTRPVGSGRAGVKVLTARHDNRVFISICGMGSWRESQQILSLCDDARKAGERSIILDLSGCTHLDSTFLGVLHNTVTSFDNDPACRFEIQSVPDNLLREMSELGLTSVLLHFRHEPVPLPDSMLTVEAGRPAEEEMGRLLLWAHEALVEADPSNADRFATVLKVLHDRAKQAGKDRIRPPESGE